MVVGRRCQSFTRRLTRAQTQLALARLASPSEPLTMAIAAGCAAACRHARLPPFGSSDQALIDVDIVPRHARHREPLFEAPAHLGSIESEHTLDPRTGLVHGVDDCPGDAFVDHLRYRP